MDSTAAFKELSGTITSTDGIFDLNWNSSKGGYRAAKDNYEFRRTNCLFISQNNIYSTQEQNVYFYTTKT